MFFQSGDFIRLILVITGIVMLFITIGSLAKRKMVESFCLAWGVVSIALILAGILARPTHWSDYISTAGLVLLFIIFYGVLYAAYFVSLKISELTRKNQELAIQVSLLNSESENVKRPDGHDVLIIIPAYNEAKTIEPVLEKLEAPEISDFCDVLVMNDASSDATEYIVKEHGHKVVTHIFNLGYGSGLQAGYKYAERKGYEYVIQMDADGQHDPSNVQNIYKALTTPDENGNCPDIVIGSRFVKDAVSFHVPVTKKIAFVLFRALIKCGGGKKIMDPTSGLQGLSRRTFKYYSGYSHFDDKYPDANMLMQMLMLGYTVKEIPAVMYARTEGKSMHSGIIKPILYMFRMVFSIMAVWARVKIFKMDR
ncbi:MAG: DUF2304 family protein [Lachnospiraceae bacterium]|nr:DUF2304 family protein [Lachnospiraceae bacterium]